MHRTFIINKVSHIQTVSRIAGINLPPNGNLHIALTQIYGIGRFSAFNILQQTGIPFNTKPKQLTHDDLQAIRNIIDSNYLVENRLYRKVSSNIKLLIDGGSYRGVRHVKKLPSRGQRTHTNARTVRRKVHSIN